MNQILPGRPTEPPAGAGGPHRGAVAAGPSIAGPGPVPPPPRRSSPPWLIALVALLAGAVVGGGALLLTGKDDGGEAGREPPGTPGGDDGGLMPDDEGDQPTVGGDSPEDVFDAFVAAAAEGDCQAALDLMTDRLLGDDVEETMANCEETPAMLRGYGHLERGGPAEVDGDTALVPVEASDGPDVGIVAIHLAQEDGAWRIDDLELEIEDPPLLPEDPADF